MTVHSFPVSEKSASLQIGAIHLSEEGAIDNVLRDTVESCRRQGYNVHGYLQHTGNTNDCACPDLFLSNIADGKQIPITQDLGQGALGCRIDSNALAKANTLIEKQLDESVNLLVLNRFGRCESQGTGLRSLIEKGCLYSIPILIAVRPKYMDQWLEFVGDYSKPISQDAEAIRSWCEEALAYSKHVGPVIQRFA